MANRRPRKPNLCELPAELERAELVHLKDVIVRLRGRALILDGSKVTRVDTSGIELLLSVIKTWAADAQSVVLSNPTESLKGAIIAIGLDPASFAIEEFVP